MNNTGNRVGNDNQGIGSGNDNATVATNQVGTGTGNTNGAPLSGNALVGVLLGNDG